MKKLKQRVEASVLYFRFTVGALENSYAMAVIENPCGDETL